MPLCNKFVFCNAAALAFGFIIAVWLFGEGCVCCKLFADTVAEVLAVLLAAPGLNEEFAICRGELSAVDVAVAVAVAAAFNLAALADGLRPRGVCNYNKKIKKNVFTIKYEYVVGLIKKNKL